MGRRAELAFDLGVLLLRRGDLLPSRRALLLALGLLALLQLSLQQHGGLLDLGELRFERSRLVRRPALSRARRLGFRRFGDFRGGQRRNGGEAERSREHGLRYSERAEELSEHRNEQNSTMRREQKSVTSISSDSGERLDLSHSPNRRISPLYLSQRCTARSQTVSSLSTQFFDLILKSTQLQLSRAGPSAASFGVYCPESMAASTGSES